MRLRVFFTSLCSAAGKLLFFLTLVAAAKLLSAGPLPTASPVAATPVPPVAVNAWGVLFQVRERLQEPGEENAGAKRDDLALADSALRVLLAEDERSLAAGAAAIKDDLQALIPQSAVAQSRGDPKILENGLVELERLYDPQLIEQAAALAEQYRCSMHPDVIGKKGDICPRCGMPLNSKVRLSVNSLASLFPVRTVIARVQVDGPLRVGVKFNAHLILTNLKNEPITLDQLREVHTRKIHLLIIDGSLTDYHHEHPVPSAIPGRYDFSFTPQKPGTYRVWADVQPVETDVQEFASTVISADTAAEPLRIEPDHLTTTVNGLTYSIRFEGPVKSGEPVQATVHIANADGSGFTQLQPIMGAFAHIVAFREDRTTALHMHPETARLLTATDRGGPDLRFRFYAANQGFYRLFVQVLRDGAQEFVPFAVNVAFGKHPPGWRANICSSGRSGTPLSLLERAEALAGNRAAALAILQELAVSKRYALTTGSK